MWMVFRVGKETDSAAYVREKKVKKSKCDMYSTVHILFVYIVNYNSFKPIACVLCIIVADYFVVEIIVVPLHNLLLNFPLQCSSGFNLFCTV